MRFWLPTDLRQVLVIIKLIDWILVGFQFWQELVGAGVSEQVLFHSVFIGTQPWFRSSLFHHCCFLLAQRLDELTLSILNRRRLLPRRLLPGRLLPQSLSQRSLRRWNFSYTILSYKIGLILINIHSIFLWLLRGSPEVLLGPRLHLNVELWINVVKNLLVCTYFSDWKRLLLFVWFACSAWWSLLEDGWCLSRIKLACWLAIACVCPLRQKNRLQRLLSLQIKLKISRLNRMARLLRRYFTVNIVISHVKVLIAAVHWLRL